MEIRNRKNRAISAHSDHPTYLGGTRTGTKTNGQQNVNSSKAQETCYFESHPFWYTLCVAKEAPTRVPKQTGTKMPTLKPQKIAILKVIHVDTPRETPKILGKEGKKRPQTARKIAKGKKQGNPT